jgi:hypothetical protein
MIHTSNIVLFLGLHYHEGTIGSGEQTMHPDWAGLVSDLLSGVILASCGYLVGIVRLSCTAGVFGMGW